MNAPVRVSWDYGIKGRPQSTVAVSKRAAERVINWLKEYGPFAPENVKIETLGETCSEDVIRQIV